MLRFVFPLGLFIACLDIYLLYGIGENYGLWAVLGVLFLPSLLFGRQAAMQGSRCQAKLQEDISNSVPVGPRLAEGLVILAARILLIYPGPITTFLGLPLLIPGIRRAVARKLVSAGRGHLPSGLTGGFSAGGPGGGVFFRTATFGGSGMAPGRVTESGLKPVEGRQVDETPPQLEKSDAQDNAPSK